MRDGYTCVLCDWLISDSLGEQLPEVGSIRAEAEVPREAHQEPIRPVPAVSTEETRRSFTSCIREYPLVPCSR